MRTATRALTVVGIGCLAAASPAWAAHPVAGATYRGRIDKSRVAFKVSHTGNTMRFEGTATVGLACPPYGLSPGPPAAVLVISRNRKQQTEGAAPPPLVRIHSDGGFSGARKGLYFRGRFSANRRRLVLQIRIRDRGCFPRQRRFHFRIR